jgi:small subunit ribosomal protein S8
LNARIIQGGHSWLKSTSQTQIKMGILQISHACSHLQNASKARLGLTSVPNTKQNLNLAMALHRSGFLSSVTRGGPHPPSPDEILSKAPEPVNHANVATRRLWLGLKYWNNEPVLKNCKAISTPKRTVTTNLQGLQRVARGFESGQVKGLNLGECLFVSTDVGVLEVREALARKVGGMVLCRVS